MLLIVGLGNPGAKYKNTYHNLGFDAVNALAERLGVKFSKTDCESKIAICKREDIIICKPQTYMNLSGKAVVALVKKFGVDPARELIVCYDDVDLVVGRLRLRESGSAGTHNGMRNIVAELGSQDFMRLRIGSATPELKSGEVALIDYVLSKVDYEYKSQLEGAIKNAVTALLELAKGTPLPRVQEKLNLH